MNLKTQSACSYFLYCSPCKIFSGPLKVGIRVKLAPQESGPRHSTVVQLIRLLIKVSFLQREITFVTSCLLSWTMQPFQNRVYSERKTFVPKG